MTSDRVSVEEWRALLTARPNLLLVGDETAISEILGELFLDMKEPVWTTTGAPLSLPSPAPGTLIVQNVTRLAVQDQARLLQWLSDHPSGVQIITTAPNTLVPFVRHGAFLDALYYRLNVMYVELGRPVKHATNLPI